MARRVYLFTNGIMDFSSILWTDDACAWVMRQTVYGAMEFKYAAGPIFGQLWQPIRARAFARFIDEFDGLEICLVGHSNGADLICDALAHIQARILEVHLVAAATPASFASNGLNRAIGAGKLCRAVCYCSKNDEALALARRLWIWHYGWLGLVGPADVDPAVARQVSVVREDAYGHTTWFDQAHLPDTMQRIVYGPQVPSGVEGPQALNAVEGEKL